MILPHKLRDEAQAEAYEYFDKNIRQLTKGKNGKVDPSAKGLQDNDVDAFRHAHVSGVLTQVYNEYVADLLGRMNEFLTADLYSNTVHRGGLNMDLWNNAIGRKYGKKTKSRKELLQRIHKALQDGELITNPDDPRKYEGATNLSINKSKPIIVLKEEKGRNEVFYDTAKDLVLTREQFVALIESGKYQGYTVKNIKGVPTPVSNPDGRKANNLS